VTAWLEQEKLDAEQRRLEETPEDEYDVLSVFCTVTHGGGVNVCVLYCDSWWWCECAFCTVSHGGVNVCSVP